MQVLSRFVVETRMIKHGSIQRQSFLHRFAMLWRCFADDTIIAGMVARADLSRDLKHFRDAAVLYQEVVRVRPGLAPIHVQCAHMFKEAGDLENARKHYANASALCPEDADLQLQIGHFHKVSGQIDEAKSSYRRAADLSPGWAVPLAELAALDRRQPPNRS